MTLHVGIEKARVYPCSLTLSMSDLCAARGHDPADIRDVMMIDERSVNPPFEDPVTMAVNAARPMLTDEDRRAIDLLIVASESGVDQEKPMSTWVQRYLDLGPWTRNFEVKHACYGGTAGLVMAASHLASPFARPGAKALVITTDQSRMHLGKPYEFVMGAGATALLVSREPRLFELEPGSSGVFTHEVSDLTRPTSRVETGNSETSLLSYIDALDNAYRAYLESAGGGVGYDHFKKNVYHAPFGGMTLRATRAALRVLGDCTKERARAAWEEKTRASLAYVRRMGGTYSSSTFIGLLSLVDHSPDLSAGDRIGMFSYGSGSCAEMYSGLLGAEFRSASADAGVKSLLDRRRRLTVAEYEAIEQERTANVDAGEYEASLDVCDGLYDRAYAGRGLLVFKGIHDHYRKYGWS